MRISAPFRNLNMSQSHSHMLCIIYSWLTVYKALYSVEKTVHLHYVCKVALLTLNANVNNQKNLYWYPLHEIALYDLEVRDQCATNVCKKHVAQASWWNYKFLPLLRPFESGNILRRINWTRKNDVSSRITTPWSIGQLLNGCPKRDSGQMVDNSWTVAF